jgi:hypothetical protein
MTDLLRTSSLTPAAWRSPSSSHFASLNLSTKNARIIYAVQNKGPGPVIANTVKNLVFKSLSLTRAMLEWTCFNFESVFLFLTFQKSFQHKKTAEHRLLPDLTTKVLIKPF